MSKNESQSVATSLLEELLIAKDDHKKAVKDFSGGMKRRCALVRGLAVEKDIYMLDEPFRALDEDNAQKVRDIIIKTAKTKLIIIVTHNEEDYKTLNAQRVLL